MHSWPLLTLTFTLHLDFFLSPFIAFHPGSWFSVCNLILTQQKGFYNYHSITAAWTNPSPWSISSPLSATLHCMQHCIACNIALHATLHCVQHCIACNISLRATLHCVQQCIACNIALHATFHCVQHCIVHCVQHCIVCNISLHATLHCVQHCITKIHECVL